MNDVFEALPIDQAAPMELVTHCKTLFYGKLGSNTVWAFGPSPDRPSTIPGVAVVCEQTRDQVVISSENIFALANMLRDHLD